MEGMSATAKQQLHDLVDALPESEVLAALRYLEFLRLQADDPMLRFLQNVPEDDEPETPEEAAQAAEGKQELAEGKGLTTEEVRQHLGL
ncbi:MAG: hypothetical protein AAF658_10935 [Myxococcota bacterium]